MASHTQATQAAQRDLKQATQAAKGEMDRYISRMMQLEVSALQKRARVKGIAEDAIQAAAAENEEDTKTVLIRLMLKSASERLATGNACQIVCQVPSPARAGAQPQETCVDAQTCSICVGCIRPPGHDGTCMDGQCNDIFPPSEDPATGNGPMVVVAEELAQQKASNDEIRRKVEETARQTAAAKEEAIRKAREDAVRKKAAEEEALRKAAEELALQKMVEEARRQAEEEARLKEAEEEAAAEARLKAIEEERARRRAEEEAEMAEMDVRCVDTFLECVKVCPWRERIRTPLKGTNLYTKHMRPCRPAGTSVDVKDSSFRNLGNFLQFLEDEGLLRLKPGLTDPVVTEIRNEACRKYNYVPHSRVKKTGPSVEARAFQ